MFSGGRIVTDESLNEVGVLDTGEVLDCRFRPEGLTETRYGAKLSTLIFLGLAVRLLFIAEVVCLGRKVVVVVVEEVAAVAGWEEGMGSEVEV